MHSNLIVPEAGLRRRSLGRHRTCDTSYTFRMGAGVPGDINRGHPVSIQPCLIDSSAPPTAYGQPVLVDATTQGVRPIVAGDSGVTAIWGVTARPYPIQQATTSNNYGAVAYGSVTPPALQPIDVMTAGYMMVAVNGACLKGGNVYIYYGTTTGAHIQGGFEAATGANILELTVGTYAYNSPPDSTGVAELKILF